MDEGFGIPLHHSLPDNRLPPSPKPSWVIEQSKSEFDRYCWRKAKPSVALSPYRVAWKEITKASFPSADMRGDGLLKSERPALR